MQDIADVGFEIPPEQRTPLVESLLRVISEMQRGRQEDRRQIDALTQEIRRLKGLPQKPQRAPRQPSTLNDPQGKPSDADTPAPKAPDDKRPGSAKRSKTELLTIHNTVPLEPPLLPADAVLVGYRDFVVQDLIIESFNTCYRRAKYRLADGSYLTAPLPDHVRGHFGPQLRAYVLYQHHHNQVTQPLLHEELCDFGVDISVGQIDRLLTFGHEPFHAEKDQLLPAAREVSAYLQTDDTSAKHCGKPGHTLHIGNEFFASFFTTDTKSRVNFLKILLTPHTEYTLNNDMLFYLDCLGVSGRVREKVAGSKPCVIPDDKAWEEQLSDWGITAEEPRRILTEAALWASLMQYDFYTQVTFLSDDAKQFQILGFLHALCWVHAERHVAELIPFTELERAAQERVRDEIWTYYQHLKAYRQTPTPADRAALEQEFDRLFQQETAWWDLDLALCKIHERRERLLLVLEHPEIPLHNNLSENDIRQYVKKRKISAGTRSDLGRRCRDTFLSLKTTCRKLGHRFWDYLLDRLQGASNIPSLPDLIRKRAAAPR